jgi:hypothetical protein
METPNYCVGEGKQWFGYTKNGKRQYSITFNDFILFDGKITGSGQDFRGKFIIDKAGYDGMKVWLSFEYVSNFHVDFCGLFDLDGFSFSGTWLYYGTTDSFTMSVSKYVYSWCGYYKEQGILKCPIVMDLEFDKEGNLLGEGQDALGTFDVTGEVDTELKMRLLK